MRQQQNNNNNNKNRMRGRGRNSNSKPSNSLNRNYESNGPDVKIRGNAAHIAEKYTTLARDALSSGDRVVAENYLQHAEHYNRIVAAANAQREEYNATQAPNNRNSSDDDNDGDDQPDINMDSSGDDDNDSEHDNNDQNDQSNRQPRRREPRNQNRSNQRHSRNNGSQSDDNSSDGHLEKPVAAQQVEVTSEPIKEEARAPRPRRTSRKKETSTDAVSPDAAGLPQGLIGGSPVRESTAVED